ncbi:MAG: class I SAM-dependent methyltransferase [Candidatus Thermoplasmatota archaeon]|nr:class I SAM-dependent methyltransferase [Candidatus Thermoplasmatota archaeon]MBS3790327.1 class I SAM-dependent methyltransferase [Candidatus Thermoplasmatota archaeon]
MKQVRPADIKDVYELRAETIDYFFPERDDEIEFWEEIASDYGEDVLHLMCGTGEISVGLAKKGFNVTALDLTNAMIYVAEDRIEEEDVDNIELLKDDARYFNLDKKFDFIFVSTGDYHHFTSREDIDAFLAKSYAHLRPEGALAIELFPLPDDDFKREQKEFDPLRAPPEGIDVWKTNQTSFDSDSQILEIKEELFVDQQDEGEAKRGEYEIQLKLFSKEEMKDILGESGFRNIRFLENEQFTPYLKNANTWVVIAER